MTLSDGSTYLHRTSSPTPIFKSTKDTRNTQLWNPSSQRLLNIEADEAGRLRAFRSRFGRGWDNKRGKEIEVDAEGVEVGEMVETVETTVPASSSSSSAAATEGGGGSEGKTSIASGAPSEGKEDQDTVVVESVEVRTDNARKALKNEDDVDEDNLLDF